MPEFFPLRLLAATFADWINREHAQVVIAPFPPRFALAEYSHTTGSVSRSPRPGLLR